MPGTERAEVYFIAAMMLLILVICGVAVYFFFKTYKSEMKAKEEQKAAKLKGKEAASVAENQNGAS